MIGKKSEEGDLEPARPESCWAQLVELQNSTKTCHSERSEESLFFRFCPHLDRREILRFAQNDRVFFAASRARRM